MKHYTGAVYDSSGFAIAWIHADQNQASHSTVTRRLQNGCI